jgi:hypothetical protein
MRRLLCTCVLLLVGCDYVFDGKAPVIPVIGAPPDISAQPRLNVNRATSRATLMTGIDGAPWAFFEEALKVDSPDSILNGRRLVRLVPPFTSDLILWNDVVPGKSAVYLFARGTAAAPLAFTTLTVRSPGEPEPGREFTLPKGPGLIVIGKLDRVFVYLPMVEGETQFLIVRSNHAFAREVALPPGIDPLDPPDDFLELAPDERSVLERHPNGGLRLHETTSMRTVDLGIRPGAAAFDLSGDTLLLCGASGLVAVPARGGAERVLDRDACDPGGGITSDASFVYYGTASGVRRVSLDGIDAPQVIAPSGLRALAFGSGTIAYSREPNDFYAHEAGDGLVGGWQFMRRGVDVRFSPSGKLHWLEDAAKSIPIGDLHSAVVGGAPTKLALNVRDYDVLADQRIIAADQQPFRGAFNRVILIDEAAGQARYVADHASGYNLIPGTTDVLVDLYTGPDTFDIVRVPLPPR